MRIVGGVMDGISSRRNNWGRRGGLSGDRGGRRSRSRGRGRGRGSWLNCSRRFSRSGWIILRKNWRRSRGRFRWGGWH